MQHLIDYPIQKDDAFLVCEVYDSPRDLHPHFYIHKYFCIWSNNTMNRIPEQHDVDENLLSYFTSVELQ